MINPSIANSEVLETTDFKVLNRYLRAADSKSLVLLDIDDNIMIPQAKIFRSTSKHRHLIDEIKNNKHNIPNFVEILTNWRLQRKVMLVDNDWPELVHHVRNKNVKIYALTQMQTGVFGTMGRVEEWRYKELTSLDIIFTPKFLGKSEIELYPENPIPTPSGITTPAIFHKGFFMTGSYSKGDILRYILNHEKPSKIIFIDDRIDHVLDVEKACKEYNIPYTGIVFRGVDILDGSVDEMIASKQKAHLLEHAEWLEDDEMK